MVQTSPLGKALMSWDDAPSRWRHVSVRSSEQHKQLKLERASHTATTVNGSIYVVAGRKGSTFYADLLRFDTATHTWSVVFATIPNGFRPRANHTATLVGGRQLWVVAGSDSENVIDDVHVFDVFTHTWAKPQLRGETSLLIRTAHSAELHPSDPRAILVFGGYGGAATASFHNDLYIIRTDALSVERVAVGGGVAPPVPRGYHSCTAVGSRCYVYGGRTEAGVVDASEMLAVFDTASSCWMAPRVAGLWPQARSSHRAVALRNRLLIHGGAAAGEQSDRLADVHTLLVCPTSGHLTWSRMDEPPLTPPPQQPPPQPPITGGGVQSRPQGRAAHTVSLVGSESLYVISGYVGAHLGPHRYSSDVYLLQLGAPVGAPLPALAPPASPSRSPPRQQQGRPSPQRQAARSPPARSPPARTAAPPGTVAGASKPPQPGAAVAATGTAPSHARSTAAPPPASPPPRSDPHSAAGAAAAARPAIRRLPSAGAPDVVLAASGPPLHLALQHPPAQAAAAGRGHQGGQLPAVGNGVGMEDDPIDLTADQQAATSPPKAGRRKAPPQRGRGGGGGAAGATASADGGWLGGVRRGRGGGQQHEAVRTTGHPGFAAGAGLAAGANGLPTGAAREATAEDRAAKRHASDAAVAAAAASRTRLPVQAQPQVPCAQAAGGAGVTGTCVGTGTCVAEAAAPAATANGTGPVSVQHHTHGSGPAGMAWKTQAEVYGLPSGSGPAAATIAAATAAMAAAAAAGGSAPGGGYHRPPSPSHAGIAANSHEALLVLFQRLQDDNQALRRQLQSAEDGDRRASQQLAAQQEQQRRTEDELSMQRRGCEMTQAALRTANKDLEDTRSQLETLQQELATARQQAAAQQQQQAAAAQQAAQREQALLQERAGLVQHHSEELRKCQEQAKSLEAVCLRQNAELDTHHKELRDEVERHREVATALNERLKSREQDASELASQLRAAASRNQEHQEALGRAQDTKQRLEREVSEAREAQQRLQRQFDEQVGDLSRQRENLQLQVTHANTRIAALEAELRRAKDDLTHRDAQHAALVQTHADKCAELMAVREQLRAAQQKQEALRQQSAVVLTHLQNIMTTGQAAMTSAQALHSAASGS